MEHFLKILSFSVFIRKRIVKTFNLKVAPPNFFDNFLFTDYKKKSFHYFVYIVCVLIHINFEQCIICRCVLLRFSVKLLNNLLV